MANKTGNKKAKKQFNVGDLVFAKVRGYPPWPAKVTSYKNSKYAVFFYGTAETGNILAENLFIFVNNREKLASDRVMKRRYFSEAMEQIEAAIRGNDSASTALPTAVAAQTHADDPLEPTAELSETTAPPPGGEFSESMELIEAALQVNDSAPIAWHTAAAPPTLAHNTLEPTAELPETTGGELNEAIEHIDAAIDALQPKLELPKTTAARPRGESELMSRSDHKIKRKDFLHEEQPADHAAKSKVETAAEKTEANVALKPLTSTPNQSRKPIAAIYPSVERMSVEIYNNIMLAFIHPDMYVGIKLDYKKPDKFASIRTKLFWEENALYEANHLKHILEAGLLLPDAVQDRVVINPLINPVPIEAQARFATDLVKKNELLLTERRFVELCLRMRQCLGLKKADVDRCLELLKHLKDLTLSEVMLLRNHTCVDIVRRLRHYVGNIENWDIAATQGAEFKYKAGIIRSESLLIYENFKKLFGFKGYIPFFEEFRPHVEAYKKLVQGCHFEHAFWEKAERDFTASVRKKTPKNDPNCSSSGDEDDDDKENRAPTQPTGAAQAVERFQGNEEDQAAAPAEQQESDVVMRKNI